MTGVVLDSSAVLAMLRQEPGGDAVADHLGSAIISAVTLQEVAREMFREGAPANLVRASLDALGLDVRAHDTDAAYGAAELFESTKKHGSGLGDRSCMALGLQLALPVLTTDREWTKVELEGLELRHVR